ncbi:uncharacterized protein LOC126788680 [Argentina anserina]|uniref:uncharacterized protein LOC126788680 n=1 Tax=Argentina anserina TaxID=57926 RepID=UPI00217685B8|nr:uncharacterized protein LOC126788680 [Potentilla anserina]
MAPSLKLGALVMVMVAAMAFVSEARELRPSEHGLEYTPAGNTSAAPAEAKSFFSGGGGGESGSSSVALPKAMNSNETTSWWEGVNARGGGKRDHHVRDVLVVVSLVCGITGVVLFVASAFVYVLRYRRKPEASSSPSL